MDIESLIEAIFKRPAIWDKRHKQHSNRIVVDKYWKDIAVELQNEEIIIRKKWKYLRDKFAVEYSKEMSRSGDTADSCPSSKWVFYQQLMFLKDIITPRISLGPLKSLALSLSNSIGTETDQPEPKQEQISDHEHESSLQDEPNQNEVPDDSQSGECMEDNIHQEDTSTAKVENAFAPLSAQKRKRKTMEYENKLLQLEKRKIQCLLNKPKRGADEEDSDLMFYKSLLCHVRLIPQEQKLQFQGEIQAVVQKYAYTLRPSEERMPYYQRYSGSYTSPSQSPSTSRE